MNTPKTIFKYEPFNAQSLKNLKAQSIYFASPLGFNDPYDCALKAGLTEPTDEELQKLQKMNCTQIGAPKEIQQLSIEGLRKTVKKAALHCLREYSENFSRENGVTCFSECNKDLLMWGHYADCYKGFCLEFSTEHEPFSKIRKVNYTNDMPKLNIVESLLNDNYDHVLDLLCTKSKSWEYEKEWRLIHQDANKLFTYDAKSLKAVYFGPEIDRESLEIICLILGGQNKEVTFWEGKRSEDKFQVEFSEFTYINFLDAKQQGKTT